MNDIVAQHFTVLNVIHSSLLFEKSRVNHTADVSIVNEHLLVKALFRIAATLIIMQDLQLFHRHNAMQRALGRPKPVLKMRESLLILHRPSHFTPPRVRLGAKGKGCFNIGE